MAQQEVDQNPWQSIVFTVSTFPDGTQIGGSGVMVGPNDVLTGSHLVYDTRYGGAATNVTVTPAFDPSPYEEPFGKVDAYKWHYFTDVDPDGDGILLPGNGGSGFDGTEHDVALLDLNVALGNDTGWMEIDPTFESGQVNLTGYPGYYGFNMMNEVGYVQDDPVDWFIPTSALEIHPGNSGGPLWYLGDNEVPYVVGIVSTGIAAYDVAAEYDTVSNWIAANDGLITIA